MGGRWERVAGAFKRMWTPYESTNLFKFIGGLLFRPLLEGNTPISINRLVYQYGVNITCLGEPGCGLELGQEPAAARRWNDKT